MARYLIKRLALIIPTFIGITMITYGMVRLAPGDYALIRAGVDGSLQQNALNRDIFENEKKLFGLDKPIYVGYVEWFGKLVRLDFGISRKDGRPVTERIVQALPVTILLNLITMLVAYIISIPLGIVSAVRRNTRFDRITALLLFVLYSLPAFWVGLLLMILFSSGEYLNWFPLGGIMSDGLDDFSLLEKGLNLLWHLVLPVATLTYGSSPFCRAMCGPICLMSSISSTSLRQWPAGLMTSGWCASMPLSIR
jgi:ABC-type dipeptide/oligopeptide/nickel transport system permease component